LKNVTGDNIETNDFVLGASYNIELYRLESKVGFVVASTDFLEDNF
jgi:hypothetical protein|tara:strand:- start:301 stop:438 length:138 start_codon:yes stop_codon:yes gene_type:complete